MKYGFIRVACCAPNLKISDCDYNLAEIKNKIAIAEEKGVKVLVFPELSITGSTCGDLFYQETLIKGSENALKKLCDFTRNVNMLIFVGVPVYFNQKLFNCCAVIFKGELLCFIPKTYISNTKESIESRYFVPYISKPFVETINYAGFENVLFGTNILVQDENDSRLSISAELSDDLFVPQSPSSFHVLNGATAIVNLCAKNTLIGSSEYIDSQIKAFSATSSCAYLLSNCGEYESTQDNIYTGESFIYECGKLLSKNERFTKDLCIADIDIELISHNRKISSRFNYGAINQNAEYEKIKIHFIESDSTNMGFSSSVNNISAENHKLMRYIEKFPFIPSEKNKKNQRCEEVINLQVHALARRLTHINIKSAVIGLSGGLDSTLALLVTTAAFDLCGLDKKQIYAITMPCFGTTDRTYINACKLAKESGATLKEINIKESVRQHFKDIQHDEDLHDVTYENSQARERTQILMDFSNMVNGIVIGTGDLSELALGWCTYNGDHMSMYGVNSDVPKTLIRHIVLWYSQNQRTMNNTSFADLLEDILDTPVSPELLPPSNGTISQVTEDLVGPYELHDFFLFNILRYGFSPSKIFYMAKNAEFEYDNQTILKWLKNFYRRFFTQQFKRSCLPDGVKVGTVGLSSRGDFCMPSDASYALWQKELESLC